MGTDAEDRESFDAARELLVRLTDSAPSGYRTIHAGDQGEGEFSNPTIKLPESVSLVSFVSLVGCGKMPRKGSVVVRFCGIAARYRPSVAAELAGLAFGTGPPAVSDRPPPAELN